MSWLSYLWSITAGICLAFGSVHFLFWLKQRDAWANLAFSIAALAAAAYATTDLLLLRSESASEYLALLRWHLVVSTAALLGIVAFIRLHLGAGRLWLLWSICGLRAVMLVLNFVPGPSFYFHEVVRLEAAPFWGEWFVRPVGVTHPWIPLMQLSHVLVIVFIIDAARSAGKRRAPGSVWMVPGLTLGALVLVMVTSTLRARGVLPTAFVGQLMLLPICGIAWQLSLNLLRVAQLTSALRASEEQSRLAADAANLGMWEWRIPDDEFWANDVARRRVGASPEERLTLDRIIEGIHPEDRERTRRSIDGALEAGEEFDLDYRTTDPSGATRWLIARGKIERSTDGKPVRLRGVSMDVTERRAAETAAREMGGRLLDAQEAERRHIARELHDHINQRLALLSIQLDAIRQEQATSGQSARPLDEISAQVKQVSSEIHGLSARLHPAKLDQLGLETACRSLCRDLSGRAGLDIEFVAEDVPSGLPIEVALGFFRILQEALANVIKHSGGASAEVHLAGCPDGLHLTVRDSGRGFDPADPGHQAGLGLISMRERARLIDARLEIHAFPGHGTRLELRTGIVPPEPTDPP